MGKFDFPEGEKTKPRLVWITRKNQLTGRRYFGIGYLTYFRCRYLFIHPWPPRIYYRTGWMYRKAMRHG